MNRFLVVFLFMQLLTGRLPAQSEQRWPGLVAEISDGTRSIERWELEPVIHSSQSNPYDQRLDPARPLHVRLTGWLEIKAAGRYSVAIYAHGKCRVELDGQAIVAGDSEAPGWSSSQPQELAFGYHRIAIDYQAADTSGLMKLYWQGPGFQLEPLSSRYLSHLAERHPDDSFQRGRLLSHGLRCTACHKDNNDAYIYPAPPAAELTRLAGNIDSAWLVDWLSRPASLPAQGQLDDDEVTRRMPHLPIAREEAIDIAAALLAASEPTPADSSPEPGTLQRDQSSKNGSANGKKPAQSEPAEPFVANANRGRELMLTGGCLACHSLDQAGLAARDAEDESEAAPERRLEYFTCKVFSGGELSAIGHKRPGDFFPRWLHQPQSINSAHRMPRPELNNEQRADLAAYLTTLTAGDQPRPVTAAGKVQPGQRLIALHRCGQCHALPASLGSPAALAKPLSAGSDWNQSCLTLSPAKAGMPYYALTANQAQALRTYWSQKFTVVSDKEAANDTVSVPTDLRLAERNCLACHARDSGQGLARNTRRLIDDQPELASRLAGLLPPSLSGVGDKLHRGALIAAITRAEEPLRPWLELRMPHYQVSEAELGELADYFADRDQIPEVPSATRPALPDDVVTRAAAGRLVTSEGFGCQSCHKIGDQAAPAVAIGARGTDLTMLGQRIRRSWFDRWVRNPVRIVPRMEMPAIQIAVHGVLDNDLDRQIDAVWEMLNVPGFQPPAAAPVRIVRGHNDPKLPNEVAHVLTDVLESKQTKYLRPLIVGLGNRHNVLFDLKRAQLSGWWIGDTARQLTRGKAWYWEAGAPPLGGQLQSMLRFGLIDNQGRQFWPYSPEQFAVELDELEHTATGVHAALRVYLAHQDARQILPVQLHIDRHRQVEAQAEPNETGIDMVLTCQPPGGYWLIVGLSGELPSWQLADTESHYGTAIDQSSTITLGSVTQIEPVAARVLRIEHDPSGTVKMRLALTSTWPVDSVTLDTVPSSSGPSSSAPSSSAPSSSLAGSSSPVSLPESGRDARAIPVELAVVPGFRAMQLPLPRTEMPAALAWYRGQLAVGSLKGRVCLAVDSDNNSWPDQWQAISDNLPTPYGLAATNDGLDVLVKYGLLRLREPATNELVDQPWHTITLADGWGYTADYHDWAVGLQRDRAGNYYLALPCQQDNRSPSEARLRGTIQKLIPQSPTSQDPRAFRLETLSAGQRFPMGLALDRQERLFASDNQGNYNPFNEINHIQAGKRYGFINKLDARPDFKPPAESPAINLPHPWTRSVNGICFLDTPANLPGPLFGPFEGHLIGCEYNGLSLIRMSLEEVNGVMQGAAYLFSRPAEPGEPTFEGPVVCAVSPRGTLTIGNIHDSGWGGGQNTGSIVELTPTGQWPLGIACVRARPSGFRIEFTGPVDAQAAVRASSYAIRSYRRISTPAYGGNDEDQRQEELVSIELDPELNAVEVELVELRPEFVYEIQVGNIGGQQKLFPNQAHYTLKQIPR